MHLKNNETRLLWKVGIVIPAFNAAATVGAVVAKAKEAAPESPIIVVDDGSSDATAQVSQEAGALVLRHHANRGKGEALRRGWAKAVQLACDAVITLDADGQHDPADLPRFVEHADRTQADIVVGTRRFDPRRMPLDRVLSNTLTSLIVSWRGGQRIPDSQCGYRLIRSRVTEDIDLTTRGFEAESELLIKAGRKGYKISSIPIETIYRDQGSAIRHIRDTVRFTRLILRSFFWSRQGRGPAG